MNGTDTLIDKYTAKNIHTNENIVPIRCPYERGTKTIKPSVKKKESDPWQKTNPKQK